MEWKVQVNSDQNSKSMKKVTEIEKAQLLDAVKIVPELHDIVRRLSIEHDMLKTEIEKHQMIAVSWSEYQKYGCVKCGCDYCYNQSIQGGGSCPVICGRCKEPFVILAEGLTESRIGFGNPSFFPKLQQHPRYGTPKNEFILPDIKPETGGEYWRPRGVGYDLSGFVKCRQAGERIVQMVEKIISKTPASWMDYRDYEPNRIQVKIQREDGFNLEKLCELCSTDGIITEERLRSCMTN